MNSPLKLPKDLVTALRPGDVQLYMTSRGWISEPFGPAGKGLLFRHPSTSQVDLLLPLTRDLADFAAQMAELVVNLSAFKQRSVWEILNDLSGPPGDVLRLCVSGSVAVLGNLPLDEAIKLLEGGRRLLRSSAFSTFRPQALHPRRALEACRRLPPQLPARSDGTRSFVATIITPVPPEIQGDPKNSDDEEFLRECEPLARQVTTSLMSSLGLLAGAIRAGTPDRILDAVSQGVGANLCEALVTMRPPGDESRLDIQVTWARIRLHLPPDIPQAVSFPQEHFAIIEEVGRRLRTRAITRRERLVGKLLSVKKSLRLHFREIAGQMVLAAEVSGEPSRVKVDLLPEEFAKACKALRDNRCVAVTGNLRQDIKARVRALPAPGLPGA